MVPIGVHGLPMHQAVMVIEGRTDDVHKFPIASPFAVNVGTDGDLSRNWVSLVLLLFASFFRCYHQIR